MREKQVVPEYRFEVEALKYVNSADIHYFLLCLVRISGSKIEVS